MMVKHNGGKSLQRNSYFTQHGIMGMQKDY